MMPDERVGRIRAYLKANHVWDVLDDDGQPRSDLAYLVKLLDECQAQLPKPLDPIKDRELIELEREFERQRQLYDAQSDLSRICKQYNVDEAELLRDTIAVIKRQNGA